MRTFSYWTLLVLGLGSSTAAWAEPPVADAVVPDSAAEPDADAEEELAGSEDAADEPAAADEAAGEDKAAEGEDRKAVTETDAETDPNAETDPDAETNPDAEAGNDRASARDAGEGCFADAIEVRRFGQAGSLALQLTDCRGEPNLAALAGLSALAQPLSAHAGAIGDTSHVAKTTAGEDADLKLLNPQLLVRVQRLAEHFPGGVEIVSGYRPHARPGSRHHSGDALDLHIDGVDNFELSEFARTLDATGVGYYPNSTFVHIDVRDAQAYWIDRSGPGQRAKYDRKAAAAALANDNVDSPAKSDDTTREAVASRVASDTDTDTDTATDSGSDSESGSASDSDAEPDAEPASDTESGSDGDSAPDPELRALADRALLVMNQALGLDGASSATSPTKGANGAT